MQDLRPEIKTKILKELSQTPVFGKDISDTSVMSHDQDRMAEAYAYVRSLEPYATEKFLLEVFNIRQPFEDEGSQVRGHALALLLQLPHIDPYSILDDVFLRADQHWRAVACRHVSELYQIWPSPVALDLLTRVLHHDESPQVRDCAVIALGEMR